MAQNKNTRKEPSEKKFIQIPGRFAPHARFGTAPNSDAMWIKLVARELKSQSTANRGEIELGKIGTTFKFLAPLDIAETHNHQWDEYDSLQKRLLEKVKGFAKLAEEGGELKNLVMNSQTALKAAKGEGTTIARKAANIANAITSKAKGEVIHTKIDAPLVYASSERRTIVFEFSLPKLSEGDDIVGAVKAIQTYAAPALQSPNSPSIFIKPPYVFQVNSEPGELIKYGYCALTSIQPTWAAPYRNGEPLMCKLTLTFQDLSPLFATTIKKGSVIKVVEP